MEPPQNPMILKSRNFMLEGKDILELSLKDQGTREL